MMPEFAPQTRTLPQQRFPADRPNYDSHGKTRNLQGKIEPLWIAR
jgi:hypothetical protein